MQEILTMFSQSTLDSLVFTVLAMITGLTVWLSFQWRLHRRTELEAALKQDMLNRGMSAEDIERVIKASGTHAVAPKRFDGDSSHLVQSMGTMYQASCSRPLGS